MAGETHQLRNFMRRLISLSYGDSYIDANDEQYRKRISMLLLRQADHILEQATDGPHTDLANTLLNYRKQLLYPHLVVQSHFKAKDLADTPESLAYDYLAELSAEMRFDFKKIIRSLNKISFEIVWYLSPNNESLLTFNHSNRIEHYQKYFKANLKLLTFIKQHANALFTRSDFADLELQPAFGAAYEFLTQDKFYPDEMHNFAKKKLSGSYHHYMIETGNDNQSPYRAQNLCERLSHLTNFIVSDTTKLNLIKAYFSYHELRKSTNPAAFESQQTARIILEFYQQIYINAVQPQDPNADPGKIPEAEILSRSSSDLDALVIAIVSGYQFHTPISSHINSSSYSQSLLNNEQIYLHKRYQYYLAKCKYKTATVMSNFMVTLKLWHELLKRLDVHLDLHRTCIPYRSAKWHHDCKNYILGAVKGLFEIFDENPASTLSFTQAMMQSFKQAELSFHYVADEEFTLFPHSLLGAEELIARSASGMIEFVFEKDRQRITNIVNLINNLLKFANRYTDEIPYWSFNLTDSLSQYYASDNAIITLFQTFAFSLAENDPSLNATQKEFITSIKKVLSIKNKLINLIDINFYFTYSCDQLAQRRWLTKSVKTRLEHMKRYIFTLPATPGKSREDVSELMLFDKLWDSIKIACAEAKRCPYSEVKTVLHDYLDKIVTLVLINDDDFHPVPDGFQALFSGKIEFGVHHYITLFCILPNDCSSKLRLGYYIYQVLHQFDYTTQLDFLRLVVELEHHSNRTYNLVPEIVDKMLYEARQATSVAPTPFDKRLHDCTLQDLIALHNQAIDAIYTVPWWQAWFDWIYELVMYALSMIPIDFRQHYIQTVTAANIDRDKFLRQSRSLLPRSLAGTSNSDLQSPAPIRNRASSPFRRGSSDTSLREMGAMQSVQASRSDQSLRRLAETPYVNHLYSQMLFNVRLIFLAQELLYAEDRETSPHIIFEIGNLLISSGKKHFTNIHKSLKSLHNSVVSGKLRDDAMQCRYRYYRQTGSNSNLLAKFLTNIISRAIIRYVHDMSITLNSNRKLLHRNKQFIDMCCLYIVEQLKYAEVLVFSNIQYHEAMFQLANHLCVEQHDFDHEREIFQKLALYTGIPYQIKMLLQVPKKHYKEFNIDRAKTHTLDNERYIVALSPGSIIYKAWNYYQKQYGQELDELLPDQASTIDDLTSRRPSKRDRSISIARPVSQNQKVT
jgi:hypothetical protein